MADTCTASVSPHNCGHRTVTIGGHTFTLHTSEVEGPLTDEEKQALYRLAIKHRGLVLAALAGRVVVGEEATNVKQYDIVAAGSVVTKTNIGTSYVDVLPGANGQRALIDFTGCTEWRIVLTANLVGTGPFQVRVVRDGDSAVIYESPSLSQTGERELDTGWGAIPGGLTDLVLVRLQAKSTTAGDDPQFRRCVVLVR